MNSKNCYNQTVFVFKTRNKIISKIKNCPHKGCNNTWLYLTWQRFIGSVGLRRRIAGHPEEESSNGSGDHLSWMKTQNAVALGSQQSTRGRCETRCLQGTQQFRGQAWRRGVLSKLKLTIFSTKPVKFNRLAFSLLSLFFFLLSKCTVFINHNQSLQLTKTTFFFGCDRIFFALYGSNKPYQKRTACKVHEDELNLTLKKKKKMAVD